MSVRPSANISVLWIFSYYLADCFETSHDDTRRWSAQSRFLHNASPRINVSSKSTLPIRTIFGFRHQSNEALSDYAKPYTQSKAKPEPPGKGGSGGVPPLWGTSPEPPEPYEASKQWRLFILCSNSASHDWEMYIAECAEMFIDAQEGVLLLRQWTQKRPRLSNHPSDLDQNLVLGVKVIRSFQIVLSFWIRPCNAAGGNPYGWI